MLWLVLLFAGITACQGKPARKAGNSGPACANNNCSDTATKDPAKPNTQSGVSIDNFSEHSTAKRLRLLSQFELANTLEQTFGRKVEVSLEEFKSNATLVNAYQNGETIALDSQSFAAWFSTTESIANWAIDNKLLNPYLNGCDPDGSAAGNIACRSELAKNLGRSLFRRGLSETELSDAKAIYDSAVTQDEYTSKQALATLIQFFLLSPNFLYRSELGDGPDANGKYQLTSIEMASAISYFLTASSPDPLLLEAGEKGLLRDKAEIEAHARRIINGGKLSPVIKDFFVQWLHLDKVLSAKKDSTEHKAWTPTVARAMLDESKAFIGHVMEQDEASLEKVFTAKYSMMNKALADFYGYDSSSLALDFRQLVFPSHQKRAGLLNQGAFLAANGQVVMSSPIRRGVSTIRDVLCEKIAPPPPDVSLVPPDAVTNDKAKTTRDIFTAHAVGSCKSCHYKIDPVGFAFENFDSLGRYRENENSIAINASGTFALSITKDEVKEIEFTDSKAMLSEMMRSRNLAKCFARNIFQYSFGKYPSKEETAEILEPAVDVFVAKNLDIRELLIEFVKSESLAVRGAE